MRRKILVALVLAIALVCVAGMAMAEATEPPVVECDHVGYGRVAKNTKPATCTTEGYTGDTYCTNCDTLLKLGSSFGPISHFSIKVTGTAATCTATGLTDGTICTVCKTVLTAQTIIPATVHVLDSEPTCATQATCTVCEEQFFDADNHEGPYTTLEADATTCTEGGLTEGLYCDGCDTVVKAQEIIPAAHTYVEEIIAPTCTEGGYTRYTCSVCEDTYTTDEVSRLLHWYGEWTPNDDGTHSATCRRTDCGHTGKADCAELTVVLSGSTITVCPVCGEAGDGTRLELVDDADCESDDDLPRGELVVRKGTLADGTELMTVAFEYAGKLEQPTGIVTISLPAEALEGYSLMLLGADGTQTALTAATEGDTLSFDLDFTTEDGEEAVPSVAIRLVPAA